MGSMIHDASCVFVNGDSLSAATIASIPSKFSSTIQLNQYAQWAAQRVGEVCYLPFPNV